MMNTIGLLTSGGDAPGIDAAIRAVGRTGHWMDITVKVGGRGYQGMSEGDRKELTETSVGNISQRGGTIVRTARSEEFETEEGRARAAESLRSAGVEALVVIGGDGSFRGASLLSEEQGVRVVGYPATIGNDVIRADISIRDDAALNTALGARGEIWGTAYAH